MDISHFFFMIFTGGRCHRWSYSTYMSDIL